MEDLLRPASPPSPAAPPPPGAVGAPRALPSARVLPFRPRDPAVRRKLRRHPVVRWGRPLLAAVAIVGAPCAAAWWLLTSPRLAVEEILVASGPRVGEAWVREVLEPYRGLNLLQLPLDTVARQLEAHPWVAAARVSKELPGTLRVEVGEREAAAILRRGADLVLVDRRGMRIVPVGEQDPSAPDLPLVSGREGREATLEELETAVGLARRLEEEGWGDLASATVSEIEVLGGGDHRVWLQEQDFPLLLRADDPGPSREKLIELMPEVRRRFDVAGVDLRFEDRIIVRTGGEVVLRVEEKG